MPGTRDRRTRHRSAPRRSLRFSFVLPFVVPAVCLTGLWGYTAAGLVDEQFHLHSDADRASSVARPAQDVLSRLGTERRLTAVWQASRTETARAELDGARDKTDAAVTEFRRSTSSALDTSSLQRRTRLFDEALDTLSARRKAIDSRTLSTGDTFELFTDTVSRGIGVLTAAVHSDDGRLARGGNATVSLAHITEMLSREDALVSGALPSRRMTAATRAQFGQYLAIQREFRAGLDIHDLPADAAATYTQLTDSAKWTAMGTVEKSVTTGRGTGLPGQASSWPTAAEPVVGGLQSLGSDSADGLSDIAGDHADDLLLGMLLGTAATLAALAGGAVLALRARRSTLGRVSELQTHVEQLSGTWLPQLLARIQSGERVEPATLAPHGEQATDELERLAGAIDQLGRVAGDTAVRQNLGREGTEKVFAQLIRRTQILIHRLISLLDDLERKHEDSDLLKDIFKVDHLATRVRRHAENLVILSGSPPSRRLTAPVSITDVMRSAVAETEQYTRVKVKNLPADRRLALAGRAVADVTHLLAELIENGTSFSPPDTQVFVSATKVAKGLAVHVEDHGLGMPQDLRDHANDLLAHPPRLDMTALGEDPRLGHFVVARLAERHKIKVELRESVYGGTLVIVLLPAALLEEVDSPVLDQLKSAAAAANRAVAAEAARAVTGADDFAVVGADGMPLVGSPVGSAGRYLDAGVTIGGVDALTHTRLPDHSGFPEYGGAGLLPAASDHPAPAPGPAASWAPPREHPAPHGHPGTEPGGFGPQAGQAGHPGAHAGHQGSRAGFTEPRTDFTEPQAGPPSRHEPGAGSGGPAPAREEAPAPSAPRPLTTPRVLPQRTRGASLAQQLRREAEQAQGRPDGEGDKGVISPDASARAMIAIQQGLKRARMSETDEPTGADGRQQTDPRDPGAHQL
ncbi:nitrate- and nitrite sensing domain-containing protein [Streptomyces avermitilis]|uniref:sensor histidine kinase n=1 Tax=Streptomyces avermitilis TaxID=33903 RepID=UPI0033D81CFD